MQNPFIILNDDQGAMTNWEEFKHKKIMTPLGPALLLMTAQEMASSPPEREAKWRLPPGVCLNFGQCLGDYEMVSFFRNVNTGA